MSYFFLAKCKYESPERILKKKQKNVFGPSTERSRAGETIRINLNQQ
jgi:hypothetical protein